jgi:hypothetical protein
VKLGSLSGGDHRWFKRSTGKKKACDKRLRNNNFYKQVGACYKLGEISHEDKVTILWNEEVQTV